MRYNAMSVRQGELGYLKESDVDKFYSLLAEDDLLRNRYINEKIKTCEKKELYCKIENSHKVTLKSTEKGKLKIQRDVDCYKNIFMNENTNENDKWRINVDDEKKDIVDFYFAGKDKIIKKTYPNVDLSFESSDKGKWAVFKEGKLLFYFNLV